jgi:hypothetical protein
MPEVQKVAQIPQMGPQVDVAEPKIQSILSVVTPGRPLSIDKKDVPAETTLDRLPRKPYWIGRCNGAPFHSVHVGSIVFPGHSFSIINGSPANQKIGALVQLTDDQVKKIKEESMKVAWRKTVIRKKVGREVKTEIAFDRVDLRSVNEVLMPGDKLTAHFVFVVALDPGQKIPLGTVDDEGKPLPTPQPLIV